METETAGDIGKHIEQMYGRDKYQINNNNSIRSPCSRPRLCVVCVMGKIKQQDELLDVTASLTLADAKERNQTVVEKGNDIDRARHKGIKVNVEKGVSRQGSCDS